MSGARLRFVSDLDVAALRPASAEILASVEAAVRAQGYGDVVLEPRVHLVPPNGGKGHFTNPGFSCGLIVVQKRVVGVLNRLRRLAMPASIGLVDTSLGQEDAMTFGFEAAENLRRVEDLVRDVISCELLVARQAWALRGAGIPAGLLDTFEQLADVVEPVEQDRPLGPDLSKIVALLGSGGLAPEFEEQAGRIGGAQ